MKQVVKVSIANIAFTLEEDAHRVLNDYLSSLESHYAGKPSGREIIDGIEERIAELLIEKAGKDAVVSRQIAEQVIAIVGKPEDIDSESGDTNSSSQEYDSEVRKKLYRDPNNKVLGGVCSGFAAYCSQDALLFRVLFLIFAVGFSIFGWHFGGFSFMLLLYLILWIAIPEARTTEQRCAMRGESTSYQDIQRNIENGVNKVADRAREMGSNNRFWHIIGRVITIFIGLIFTVVGLSGVVACIVAFFGIQFWGFTLPMGILDTVAMFTGESLWMLILVKVLLLLVIFLPFVGILYSGIQLLFDFKSPRWRPGLVIFILWVISLLVLAGLSAGVSSRFWNTDDQIASVSLDSQSDTLYVQFEDVERWKDEKVSIKADREEYKMFFIDKEDRNDSKVILYPNVKIIRNDEDSKMVVRTHYIQNKISLSDLQNVTNLDFYSFQGNTLSLQPMVIERGCEIKDVSRSVRLYVPEDKVVIVKEPIYHQFDRRFNYSNIKFWESDVNFDFDF